MNEAVKWMMAGMFLLSFHIDFMGIPIVPGIVGACISQRFQDAGTEGDGEGFEWNRKMEQTGRLWLGHYHPGPDSGSVHETEHRDIHTDHGSPLCWQRQPAGAVR